MDHPQIPGVVGDSKEALIVETSYDLDAESEAERAVTAGLADMGAKLEASQSVLVAMTPDGAVRAMVGGASYQQSPYNRATDAERQPGSAFKPFVYLTAFEHGRRPDDIMNDGPVDIHGWKPGDFEGEYQGEISLTRAFAVSSNSVAAQLTAEVGPGAVGAHGQAARHRDTLAGGVLARARHLDGDAARTHVCLRRLRQWRHAVEPFGIVRIRTRDGKVLWEHKSPDNDAVMSPENLAK